MNLSESVRHVLKNSSQSVLQGFLYQDVRAAAVELKEDFEYYFKHREGKKGKIFNLAASIETLASLKEVPLRLKRGFNSFKDEFITELDSLEDGKEKAVFSLKVLGALSTLAAGVVMELRKTGSKRTPLANFILSALLVRLSQLLLLRFFTEVEKHLTEEDDLSRIRFFRHLLMGKESPSEEEQWSAEDRAFQLVDSFKNYIMTGKES